MFYIDESGSIPKTKDTRYKHRYFVISFVHTENPRKVETVYNHAIRSLKNKFPDVFKVLPNPNEMKGSEMPPFMKYYVFKKLFRSTDIKIAHMVVDTLNIEDRFRINPGRSFNYLIKIIMKSYALSPADIENLTLKIDNRNTAIEGLRELEGFLFNTLVLDERIISGVQVEYLESCNDRLIQIADIFAHTIYQRFRYKTMPFPNYDEIEGHVNLSHPYTYEYLYQFVKPMIVMPFVYPPSKEKIAEVAATISL